MRRAAIIMAVALAVTAPAALAGDDERANERLVIIHVTGMMKSKSGAT